MGAGVTPRRQSASPVDVQAVLPAPETVSGLRIGLLGGSFNPAHEGHLFITGEALKRFKLDRVWWLVSPRNPLKKERDLAPYRERLAGARELARHPKIKVMDFEHRLGLFYTVDTLSLLKRHLPGVHFVWLMGADCLLDFTEWKAWETIFRTLPIAVFARPGYSVRALNGKAARRFKSSRVAGARVHDLALMEAPAWAFIESPEQSVSGTALRHKALRKDKGTNN